MDITTIIECLGFLSQVDCHEVLFAAVVELLGKSRAQLNGVVMSWSIIVLKTAAVTGLSAIRRTFGCPAAISSGLTAFGCPTLCCSGETVRSKILVVLIHNAGSSISSCCIHYSTRVLFNGLHDHILRLNSASDASEILKKALEGVALLLVASVGKDTTHRLTDQQVLNVVATSRRLGGVAPAVHSVVIGLKSKTVNHYLTEKRHLHGPRALFK